MSNDTNDEWTEDDLRKETVRMTPNSVAMLKDGRTAIWDGKRVVFKGRWDPPASVE